MKPTIKRPFLMYISLSIVVGIFELLMAPEFLPEAMAQRKNNILLPLWID
jgi:hypothetical protein